MYCIIYNADVPIYRTRGCIAEQNRTLQYNMIIYEPINEREIHV